MFGMHFKKSHLLNCATIGHNDNDAALISDICASANNNDAITRNQNNLFSESSTISSSKDASYTMSGSSTEPYRDPQLLMRDYVLQQQQNLVAMQWFAAAHHHHQQQQLVHNRLSTGETTGTAVDRQWGHLYTNISHSPFWMMDAYSKDLFAKTNIPNEHVLNPATYSLEKGIFEHSQHQLAHAQAIATTSSAAASSAAPVNESSTKKLVDQHFNLSLTNPRTAWSSRTVNKNSSIYNPPTTTAADDASSSSSLMELSSSLQVAAHTKTGVVAQCSSTGKLKSARGRPCSTKSLHRTSGHEATSSSPHASTMMSRSIGQIVENTVKLCYARDNNPSVAILEQHNSPGPLTSRNTVSMSTPSNSTCSPTGSFASSRSDGTLTPATGSAASPTPSFSCTYDQLQLPTPSSNTSTAIASTSSELRLPSKKVWLAKHMAEIASFAPINDAKASLIAAYDDCQQEEFSSSAAVSEPPSCCVLRRGIKRPHNMTSESQLDSVRCVDATPEASTSLFAASASINFATAALTASASIDLLFDNGLSRKRKRKPLNEDKHAVELNPAPNYTTLAAKPLNSQSRDYFERTGEAFVQDGTCLEVAPKLVKCRECRQAKHKKGLHPTIYCRFVAFRRLKFNKKGLLMLAGFCDVSIADREDIALWMPHYPISDPNMSVAVAHYIVQHVGDKFCDLVDHEKKIKRRLMQRTSLSNCDTNNGTSRKSELLSQTSLGSGGTIAWKRAVQGIRELCDVCETSVFNFHWICRKCGYTVCMDCYECRTLGAAEKPNAPLLTVQSNSEPIVLVRMKNFEPPWQSCTANRQPHDANKLMLTQIIPGDALLEVARCIQEIRNKWIPVEGYTAMASDSMYKNQSNLHLAAQKKSSNLTSTTKYSEPSQSHMNNAISSSIFVNAALQGSCRPVVIGTVNTSQNHCNNTSGNNINHSYASSFSINNQISFTGESAEMLPLSQDSLVISDVTCTTTALSNGSSISITDCREPPTLIPHHFNHYFPRSGQAMIGRCQELSRRTLAESKLRYPNVLHNWLCDGRLLHLQQANNSDQLALFQEQWTHGQPVIVSGCHSYFQLDLWKPQSFMQNVGNKKVSVINCETGMQLPLMNFTQFWKGFSALKKRTPVNDIGRAMPLKLKDWPTIDDFMTLLAENYRDVSRGLPLQEYTSRSGVLNLASRLPEYFVPPDLGPKLYAAYGMARAGTGEGIVLDKVVVGTRNLHLDVADSVNVLVHVEVPDDAFDEERLAALHAIENARCDAQMLQRIHVELPGVLWHVFDACDADKIRDFLNKVAKERGEKIEPDHNAIHDESCYLSLPLLDRLAAEYDVHGCIIVQFLGDAVFIPAGAPHQVRNLHSCVNVVQNFVSPENLYHCFKLTAEFRLLSSSSSQQQQQQQEQSREDKLQVKNIIYHAVKDSVAVLCATMNTAELRR